MKKPTRIGLFGGQFDPFHLGHEYAISAAITAGNLDKVMLIPSGDPPHRHKSIASNTQRLAMLTKVRQSNWHISDYELTHPGPHYTLNMVSFFQQTEPNATFFLIIGSDQFAKFHTWHQYEALLNRIELIVVKRENEPIPQLSQSQLSRCQILDNTRYNAASSQIRQTHTDYHPKLANYIKTEGLYQ